MTTGLLFLLALLPASPAGGPVNVALATTALERIDEVDADHWSYTKTTRTKEGITIERHDATKSGTARWTLVQKNGRKPSAKEVAAYLKEKAKELEQTNDDSESDGQEVDFTTFQLVSESDVRATFNFRVEEDEGLGSSPEQILGTLVVNKDGGWPERFELASTGPISPFPGVKLSEFNLTLTFQRDAGSGEILPQSISMKSRGRAFLVKSLDDERVTTFSDFVRAR